MRKLVRILGAYILVAVVFLGELFPASQALSAERQSRRKPRASVVSDGEEETLSPQTGKLSLEAVSRPGGKIKLRWDEVDGAAGYYLLRSREKDGTFHVICSSSQGECVYTDRQRIPGKAYYYQLAVRLRDSGACLFSGTVRGYSLKRVKLTKISNVSGSRKLVLHWKSVKGAAGYEILRRGPGEKKFHTVAAVRGKKTHYTDTRRRGGRVYSYKVCARDCAGGRGNYSAAMSQMAIDKHRKMIALTYDDGPSPYTPVVLKALKKYKAHATFYVVGSCVEHYGRNLRREISLGCEIGNHTYSHNNLSRLSEQQVKAVLSRTSAAVRKQGGGKIRTVRPPGGNYDAAVCRAAGAPIVLWSVDTRDWATRSTSATIRCVLERAGDGAVVLMHDLHKSTADAADAIIGKLTARGYQLLTVSEMAAYRGGMKKGRVYHRFQR